VPENRREGDGGADCPQTLTLRLDGFASEALKEEARRLGVSSEELARFSVLYYLADLDSGRIARRAGGAPLALQDA